MKQQRLRGHTRSSCHSTPVLNEENNALDSSHSSLSYTWSNLLAQRARGRLTAITQAVRSNATVQGALETLVARGMVPDDWLDTDLDRRGFAPLSLCGACERGYRQAKYSTTRRPPQPQRCFVCDRCVDRCARAALPALHDDLVAFALDPQGIESAERLASELFARVPEVARRAPRVLWWCVEADRAAALLAERRREWVEYNPLDELGCLANDLLEPVERARVARGESPWRMAWPAWLETAPSRAREHLRAAGILRAAQLRLGVRREADRDPLDALIDDWAAVLREDVAWAIASGCDDLVALAHERNPFEPAMALWKLGFGVHSVTTESVALVLPSART